MLFHPNPDSFIAETADYGAFGKAVIDLSNLEYAHDQFVFEVFNWSKDLALGLSNKFPRQFPDKTDFLIAAIAHVPMLRQYPMSALGELDLLWLQDQLDELYEIRAILAHGSVFYSEKQPNRITWRFERHTNLRKHTWGQEAVEMSNGYLASVSYTATYIRHYLLGITRCLAGRDSWEDVYRADKEIRKNNRLFRELEQLGILQETDWAVELPEPKPVGELWS